jgi:hypothetical protein
MPRVRRTSTTAPRRHARTLLCPVLGYWRIQGATSHSSAQPLHASQAFAKLVFARICSVCVRGMVLAKKGGCKLCCAQLGVIDRVTSIRVSEIGG